MISLRNLIELEVGSLLTKDGLNILMKLYPLLMMRNRIFLGTSTNKTMELLTTKPSSRLCKGTTATTPPKNSTGQKPASAISSNGTSNVNSTSKTHTN